MREMSECNAGISSPLSALYFPLPYLLNALPQQGKGWKYILETLPVQAAREVLC